MEIARLPNWENALTAYVDEHRNADKPCADFVAGAVEAMTGTDIRVHFRGRLTWVRDHLEEAAGELFEERPVPFARTGDIVMTQGCVGVVYAGAGAFMALHEGEAGIAFVPMSEWQKAWTVG